MLPPAVCPCDNCQGQFFKDHQLHCRRPLRDTRIDSVEVYRRKCPSCGRTHRLYPQGVTRAQQSDRLKGQTILLYTLGISYRGVEDFLETFDHCVDHTTVYRNVQAAGEAARQLGRVWLHQLRGKVAVVGSDPTYVRCRGEQVAIAVAVDDAEGMMLDIELLDDEERETVKGWLPPLLELVGAEALSSDDQDAFKVVADTAGVSHQICRRHVTNHESLDDALGEIKRRFGLESDEHDPFLRDLLARRLTVQDGRWVWPGGMSSALVWWEG